MWEDLVVFSCNVQVKFLLPPCFSLFAFSIGMTLKPVKTAERSS